MPTHVGYDLLMAQTTNRKGTAMSTTTSTFNASVGAIDAQDALERVAKFFKPDHRFYLAGFSVTGRVAERSAKHGLWTVEIEKQGGNVNDAWVILTSYGISPDKTMGSMWQTVKGVGA